MNVIEEHFAGFFSAKTIMIFEALIHDFMKTLRQKTRTYDDSKSSAFHENALASLFF
jgi:hypothetical protein